MQALLLDKIRACQAQLEEHSWFNPHLVYQIHYLQSVRFNVNLFGRFNPLIYDEQAILDKLNY